MSALVERIQRLSAAPSAAELAPLYAEPGVGKPSAWLAQHHQPTRRAWASHQHQTLIAIAWFSVVVDEAELLDIRVASAFRGAGVGTRLLSAALAELRLTDAVSCHLEVRASNGSARRLYERLGFVAGGRRADYYPSPAGREDAILMTLVMQPTELP